VAFVGGKILAYVLMIGLLFYFGSSVNDSQGESGESAVMAAFKVVIGVLLLVFALKTLAKEPDPDAPPPKLQSMLQSQGAAKLFVIGFGISFIQIRFVLLLMAGMSIIRSADLSTGSSIVSSLILVLALTWPLIVPIIVYIAMGDRRTAVMNSMNDWLTQHSRIINVVVLTLFGIVLLEGGISDLL
jgi:Sap, sulfolipid-1-addressing protein